MFPIVRGRGRIKRDLWVGNQRVKACGKMPFGRTMKQFWPLPNFAVRKKIVALLLSMSSF
jgi:hypothetical protein